MIHGLALSAGALCSGLINFFINVELLDGFLERLKNETKVKKLSGWRKFRYYAGSFAFILTGVLFGMMAFTFGMATPLSLLAIASGIFVAIIMTIQEVETWLQSFDGPESDDRKSLKDIFTEWKSTLTFGKMCGHMIAAGNVIALSLLFTLGLAEVLIALHVAALPALIIGLSVAFTIGAFTEFYFYNFFLASFCAAFQEKWQAMKNSQLAPLGFLCVATNAFVNAALTYSGVGLLTGLLVAAGVALPPVGVIIALSAISGFFAGSASLVLGMDFWIRKMSPATSTPKPATPKAKPAANDEPGFATKGLSFFQSNHPDVASINPLEQPNNNVACIG